MESRKYPYTAWVLTPSFAPKQVELVRSVRYSGLREYDVTDRGKPYHVDDLHGSKAAAIAVGRQRLAEQRADLEKRAERIKQREAALDKASK